MPCFERFDRQTAEYRESILPINCVNRIAIEAGVSLTWGNYLGLHGKSVCIDRFGLSAPGGQVMEKLGLSVDNIVAVAKS
jgi:transketolase